MSLATSQFRVTGGVAECVELNWWFPRGVETHRRDWWNGEPVTDARAMSSSRPVLNMVNLVSRDVAASLAFYNLLGLDTPEPPERPEGFHHSAVAVTEGAGLEIDNEELARIYAAPWREERGAPRTIMNFGLATRAAVDDRYAALTGAGYRGLQPPWDAFWGARYAIVEDPDGNAVGLMSVTDPDRREWPPAESPSP